MVICLERGADLHMPSWCHCHSLSLASVKSRLILPFWYRPTQVVLEKGLLNGRVCVCNSCFMAIFRDKSVIWFHLGSTPSPRFSEDNTGILVGWVFYRPAVLPAPCKISITAQRRTLVTSTNHESGLVHSSSTTKLLTWGASSDPGRILEWSCW